MKTIDFDFFTFIATHPKLNIDLSIQLLDFFSKLALSDIVHNSVVVPIYFKIIERYKEEKKVETSV